MVPGEGWWTNNRRGCKPLHKKNDSLELRMMIFPFWGHVFSGYTSTDLVCGVSEPARGLLLKKTWRFVMAETFGHI